MCKPFVVILVSLLCLAGCSQTANSPAAVAPVAPTALLSSSAASVMGVEVPFHSDVAWTIVNGSEVQLCTAPLPEGKVYLMRNTLSGTSVSTHLGRGAWLGQTCVYGTPEGGPEGWLMDVQWTAANGDTLLATAEFVRWLGTPGQSAALEKVTFRDGGTGRFEYAEGTGTCHVDAPGRTAAYEGSLRYGMKEK